MGPLRAANVPPPMGARAPMPSLRHEGSSPQLRARDPHASPYGKVRARRLGVNCTQNGIGSLAWGVQPPCQRKLGSAAPGGGLWHGVVPPRVKGALRHGTGFATMQTLRSATPHLLLNGHAVESVHGEARRNASQESSEQRTQCEILHRTPRPRRDRNPGGVAIPQGEVSLCLRCIASAIRR